MHFDIQTESCFEDTIGRGGLSKAGAEKIFAEAKNHLKDLLDSPDSESAALLALPEREDDLEEIRGAAARFWPLCKDVLVLGTGGSSLGGQSLNALADLGFGPRPGVPKLHFLDSIDPAIWRAALESFDPQRLGVVVISKSGGTAETLTQILVVLAYLRDAGVEGDLAERIVAIAGPGDSPLRKLVAQHGLLCLEHEEEIGGRFSVLSKVGLLPAAIVGLDIKAFRKGAAEVVTRLRSDPLPPAAEGAALMVGLQRERGCSQSVLMTYGDRLADFGLWYRQLWAESLGKDGHGTTPVRALGPVDQHSQLQLYLGGPWDKVFTVIHLATAGEGGLVASGDAEALGVGYLGGRRMGDLMDAEARATVQSLINNGRPTRLIGLDTLDEAALGGLYMHFILETILAARLFGVSPYGQPAVEEGKKLARQFLAEMPAATETGS